ncbi:MAG: hypothetical protein DRR00_33865 [Candidatus Parabeggiatoa sp. nov. 3]|nr:MAG: hypothetical protein DRR00_33865 [Gammaproteobacteria bacterium]
MNHKPEDILAATRHIHPHLEKWLGTEAPVVEAKLAQLLEQAQNLTEQMRDLLQTYPKIHALLQQYLDDKSAPTKKEAVSRGEGIPDRLGEGAQTPSGIRVYICQVEGCDYRWYQQRIGETPPLCFDHTLPLKEEKS